MKKAIILDLDNTIFPVPSIGDKLFSPLFQLVEEDGHHAEDMKAIRDEIMRIPFQQVAANHKFSEELTHKGIEVLKEIKYEGKIEPFEDFEFVKNLALDKFLVTTGFVKMQQGKVNSLDLEPHFKEIHIIDPTTNSATKKDVFAAIMEKHQYEKTELLVIGDDLHSEIKAAQELGIDVVLYDKYQRKAGNLPCPVISDFRELKNFLL
jgi:putative hydrolase of the HAD superfamily